MYNVPSDDALASVAAQMVISISAPPSSRASDLKRDLRQDALISNFWAVYDELKRAKADRITTEKDWPADPPKRGCCR